MIEFEDYMCYIECSENVSDVMQKKFIYNCKSEFETFSDAQKHYALCDINDIPSFHQSLKNYLYYLDDIIPKLVEILKSKYGVDNSNIAFGYFGFEIHSN